MFPTAIDIISTSLAVAYSDEKYTYQTGFPHFGQDEIPYLFQTISWPQDQFSLPICRIQVGNVGDICDRIWILVDIYGHINSGY